MLAQAACRAASARAGAGTAAPATCFARGEAAAGASPRRPAAGVRPRAPPPPPPVRLGGGRSRGGLLRAAGMGSIDFPGVEDLEGGYTPFGFINFGMQELKHELQVAVDASPETLYQLWKNPDVIMECFDFVTDYMEFTEDGGMDSAGMTLMYKLGTYPTLELKFVWERTEDEENSKLSVHTVEGMPLLASVKFDPSPAGTTMKFSTLYSMPVQLGLFEDPLVVHRHVDHLLKQYLDNFKRAAEAA